MWFSVADISVNQVDATRLGNPKNPGNPMVLDLFQRESRTAFTIHKTKRVFPQYVETTTGTRIPKRSWSPEMVDLANHELAKLSPQPGGFKLTIVGWVFAVFFIGFFSYLTYEAIQAPAKKQQFEERQANLRNIEEGEIYFGRQEVYETREGPFPKYESSFGWFKVVRVENDTYHLAKSVEMADTPTPKETLNNTEFEQETLVVKARKLEEYHKTFRSEDGLTDIVLNDLKEQEK